MMSRAKLQGAMRTRSSWAVSVAPSASLRAARKHLGLVRRLSEYGFIARIVADEAEIIRAAPSVLE